MSNIVSLIEKMSNLRQKIVLFIQSNDKDYGSASTIANLYMNRFAIDEDAGHEIVKIYEVSSQRGRLTHSEEKKEQNGTDQMLSL